MAFLTSLHVQHLTGQRKWILTAPLSYQTKRDEVINVPVGFETDGASVPRVFWWLFPPTGVYLEAAVVHDWLYHQKQIRGKAIARSRADAIFLQAMDDIGVSWLKRKVIWSAVRAGGWLPWGT